MSDKERVAELLQAIEDHPIKLQPQMNYIQTYIYEHEVLPMYNEISNIIDKQRQEAGIPDRTLKEFLFLIPGKN